jgi:hypothetical protein
MGGGLGHSLPEPAKKPFETGTAEFEENEEKEEPPRRAKERGWRSERTVLLLSLFIGSYPWFKSTSVLLAVSTARGMAIAPGQSARSWRGAFQSLPVFPAPCQ